MPSPVSLTVAVRRSIRSPGTRATSSRGVCHPLTQPTLHTWWDWEGNLHILIKDVGAFKSPCRGPAAPRQPLPLPCLHFKAPGRPLGVIRVVSGGLLRRQGSHPKCRFHQCEVSSEQLAAF